MRRKVVEAARATLGGGRGSKPRETSGVRLHQNRTFRIGSGSGRNKTGQFRNLSQIFPKSFRKISEMLRKDFGVVLVLVLVLEKVKPLAHLTMRGRLFCRLQLSLRLEPLNLTRCFPSNQRGR